MDFTFSVKNFGKIQEANIQVKNLTVLAGQNNSGKTFVSKALYSIFHSIFITNNALSGTFYPKEKRQEIFKGFLKKEDFQIIEEFLISELKGNFQVTRLKKISTNNTIFNVSNIGTVKILEENVAFTIKQEKYSLLLQNIFNLIYLESPIYLKLKPALTSTNLYAFSSNHITGVPNYFYQLSDLLNLQSKNEPEFPDILNKIEESIGGKLKQSDDGTFLFKNQDGTFPISTTALGIANLGLLAMLLEKNLLDKNSFLFIDEPEAHLHPQWQVLLIEVLYELAKAGVNIMIATHSIDIIKYIEVLWKQDKQQAESLIGLNCLTTEGKTIHENADFETKLDAIKQELSEPFYELYLKTL